MNFNGGYWECLQMKKEIPNSPHTSLYSRASRIWATARYGRATHLATHSRTPPPRTRVRHHHAWATFTHRSPSRIGIITHTSSSRRAHFHTFLMAKHWSRTRMRPRHARVCVSATSLALLHRTSDSHNFQTISPNLNFKYSLQRSRRVLSFSLGSYVQILLLLKVISSFMATALKYLVHFPFVNYPKCCEPSF